MRFYECTVILCPELSKQQIEEVYKELDEVLKPYDGEASHFEYWGLKSLAYPIEKFTRAHYMFFHVTAPTEAVIELERKMKIREDILRYLTIRVDELDEEPTPMMQAKNRDEARKQQKEKDAA